MCRKKERKERRRTRRGRSLREGHQDKREEHSQLHLSHTLQQRGGPGDNRGATGEQPVSEKGGITGGEQKGGPGGWPSRTGLLLFAHGSLDVVVVVAAA